MKKLLLSLLVLASFVLPSALFGASVNAHVDAGQRIEISVNGTVYGEIYLTNIDTGQLAAVVYVAPYNPGNWNINYYYNGGVYPPGAAFTENNYSTPTSATITGLPAGNYQIAAYGVGDVFEENTYQSGSTYYMDQSGLYDYNDWIGFAFDIW